MIFYPAVGEKLSVPAGNPGCRYHKNDKKRLSPLTRLKKCLYFSAIEDQ
jgi:hypothetical protein